MAYDLIRWGGGVVLFVVLLIILTLTTKKGGKSALIAAFISIILSSATLLFPVENLFYSFPNVESIFSYRHHEALITFAVSDEGVLCVGKKDENNFVYYSFCKTEDGYKLPSGVNENINFRSSKFGIYIFKRFENQTIILTQTQNSSYDGKAFSDIKGGYSYIIVDGEVNYSLLQCEGEKVSLV